MTLSVQCLIIRLKMKKKIIGPNLIKPCQSQNEKHVVSLKLNNVSSIWKRKKYCVISLKTSPIGQIFGLGTHFSFSHGIHFNWQDFGLTGCTQCVMCMVHYEAKVDISKVEMQVKVGVKKERRRKKVSTGQKFVTWSTCRNILSVELWFGPIFLRVCANSAL